MRPKPISGFFLSPILLLTIVVGGVDAACSHTSVIDPRDPSVSNDETNGPVPVIDADDIIGISADGNRIDPDDIAASPLALAIIARQGWQNKLVHFSYNDTPMAAADGKDVAHHNGIQNAIDNFGYDRGVTMLFNCQADSQWLDARNHVIETILSTTASRHFYWIQAGPHEFAYQVLERVAAIAPGKLANVTLVSHSGTNNGSSHPVRPGIRDGSDCGRKLEDCLGLSDDLGYFFTSRQGRAENFGTKGRTPSNWPTVAWMSTIGCAGWNGVHNSFLKYAEIEGGDPGLDASDAGMAYTMVTRDPDGNFVKLTDWVAGWCYEGGGGPGGPEPVAQLTLSATTVAVGEAVTISASDSVPSAGASDDAFLFRFNQGVDNTDSQWVYAPNDEVTHVYTTPGTYDVRVFMRDSAGLKDWSDTQTITVTSGGGGGVASLLQDVFVNKNKADQNFDGSNIRASVNGTWVSYLEFDISAFSGSSNALLSLYCTNGGNGHIDVFSNETLSWDESALTYGDTGPFKGARVKVGEISGDYAVGSFVDIALSNVPLGGDTITLILEGTVSNDSTQFHSKESAGDADHIPMLEIIPVGGG